MSAATTGYSVEQVDPRDRDIVISTYSAAWAGDAAPPLDMRSRCEWLYLSNPAGLARIFALRAPSGDSVGMLAMVPRRFSFTGSVRTMGLLCDFIVHRAHRTGMPALMLQRAARRCAESIGWGTYAIPNDKSLRLIQRMGGQIIAERPRVARPLRHYAYLRRRSNLPVAPAALGLDTLAHAWDVGLSTGPRRYRSEWRDEFDIAAHDSLWLRVAPAARMGERSGTFLRWRFSYEPNRTSPILAITRARSSKLVAYAVGELHDETFEVRDFLWDPAEISPVAFIGMIMRRARAIGAGSASFRTCPDARIGRAFGLLGLRPRESETVLYFGLSPSESTGLHLTRADEDV